MEVHVMNSNHINIRSFIAIFAAMLLFSLAISAQTTPPPTDVAAVNPKPTASVNKAVVPAFKDFRGAKIGMNADDLKQAWGKPETEDMQGFLYRLSDDATVQVSVDADKKVSAIAATFIGGRSAPALTDVFGPDAVVKPKDDKLTYHMVRYPDAGYWVSYYRGAGDDAVVTLMMQKL